MPDRIEQIESIKAGSLSGIAAGVSYGLMITIDRLVWHEYSSPLSSLGWEVAISIIDGLLFGVTYRYIIRTDRNDHLNAGAVLAFGLVRGLAQVHLPELELAQIWSNGLIVGKSILLFAIARYTLDYAISLRWISPFKSS